MSQELTLTKKQRTDFDKAQESYCATKKKAVWLLVGGPLAALTCGLIFQETLLGPFLSAAGGFLSVVIAGLTLIQNKSDWKTTLSLNEAWSRINRRFQTINLDLLNTDSIAAHRDLIARKKSYLKERSIELKQAAPVYQPPSRRVAGWGVLAGLTIGATMGAEPSTTMQGVAAVTFTLWKAWENHTIAKGNFDKSDKEYKDEVREFRSDLKSYRGDVRLYACELRIKKLDQECKAPSL